MAERASERLVRLLGLVTYLDSVGGAVPVEQIARDFGVPAEQVLRDIDLLWVSGTPGYWPDNLLDFAIDDEAGTVSVVQTQRIERPLRLGTREAVSLIAALRAMGEAIDVAAPELADVVRAVLEKLTDAAGEASGALDVRLAVDTRPEVAHAVGEALATRRRLRLRYVTASDVVSERTVDPMRLRTEDERSYLVAWCLRADDERTFRLDRILEAVVLEDASAEHAASARPYRPAATAEPVRVTFASPARWIAEQVPHDGVQEHDDGAFTLTLRIENHAWLRQLLLANATNVRAVSPEALRADLVDAAASALRQYED